MINIFKYRHQQKRNATPPKKRTKNHPECKQIPEKLSNHLAMHQHIQSKN